MRLEIKRYLVVAMLLMLCSCDRVVRHVQHGEVVAMVDNTSLSQEEVQSAIPQYLKGADSLDFARKYVDKWIKRQVKVEEAERIFSTSVHEVERMVNSYRQALMTQRLDQFYINSSGPLSIDEEQIHNYYNSHSDNFRLEQNIVKGLILRLPLNSKEESKLKKMMASNSKDSRLNLISISEKYEEYNLEEFTDNWIDYDDLLSKLPIVRDSKSGVYMTRKGVQRLQDSEWIYLFEITAYRSAGYVAPLERVEQTIRQILTSDLQTQMLREREERLYKSAKEQGIIYNHLDNVLSEDTKKNDDED